MGSRGLWVMGRRGLWRRGLWGAEGYGKKGVMAMGRSVAFYTAPMSTAGDFVCSLYSTCSWRIV